MSYIICDVCGKGGFKSKAGLVGHKKITHGVDTRKTVSDDIGKRLDCLNDNMEVLSTVQFMFMQEFFKLGSGHKAVNWKVLEGVLKRMSGKNKWQDNPVLKGLKSAISHKGKR